MKHKKHLIAAVVIGFALLTGYLILYAFFHREKGDLIFIIFNSYALLAIVLCVVMVHRSDRNEQLKKELTHKRLTYLTQNLTAPAMLWNDSVTEVILNDALRELANIRKHEEINAKEIVPMFFGKKEAMTDADIREIVNAKNHEYAFTARGSVPRNMIWNTSAVETGEDGVTWLLSIGMDLADIRNMESKLKIYTNRLSASEDRHNLTIELMDVGLLLIEQGNPKIFTSEKLQKMFGLRSNSITVPEIRKMIYPLDVVAFDTHVQTMRSHMKHFIDKTDTLELRICSAEGQYRWYSYRYRATTYKESGRLVVGGTVIDITEEKQRDAKMEKIAYEDMVTGIPNRNKLMRMGSELYECTSELHNSYWVIVMDIDRFHLINDTCGYAAGNALLRSFADVLVKQLSQGGFGARISGDNFALILRDTGDDSLPEKIIAKVQRALLTKAVGDLSNRSLTCSAGYARMPADGDSFEHILEHAEFALSSGSNALGSVSRYTPAMHDEIIHDSNLESQLHEALSRNELELYYQPKVSLETGEIVGLEALIRWNHPSGKVISPGVFIPIAERSQLITQITRFVMYDACRQMKVWQTMGLPDTVVSINFSSTDFYQENICAQIQNALDKYGLAPSCLEIELTESLALMDIDTTIERMHELRRAGIKLAMDDFGTGYSSLSYIEQLPFSIVKLDRSFVTEMHDNPVVQEIVHSVARIAKAKQIHTIAEGVETDEQAQMLRAAGCEYAQGYLYGRPMTARQTEKFIRDSLTNKIVY